MQLRLKSCNKIISIKVTRVILQGSLSHLRGEKTRKYHKIKIKLRILPISKILDKENISKTNTLT